MKKLMTILLAAVLLASCDKFLDLKPENGFKAGKYQSSQHG